MFDEPSSYLDVKQRLKAAIAVRNLVRVDKYSEHINGHLPKRMNQKFTLFFLSYVIVVEHDLAVLDYLSDFICVLYGVPAAYGVVTMPFSVREGINIFLDGFVPTENLRFRETALSFKVFLMFLFKSFHLKMFFWQVSEQIMEEEIKRFARYQYPKMSVTLG